jgi:hypothetical protein
VPPPNQLGKFNFSSLQPDEQKQMDQIVDTINAHSGYNGPIQPANHIDMGGARITGIGAPQTPTDAIPSGVAASTYSASALKPQISPGGPQSMPGYRQLNSSSQREQSSSWLNDLPSAVPNASQVFPTVTSSGGGVLVSIPAALFTYADGSTTMLNARTDLLSLPAQYAISSITLSGITVTITTTTASGLVAGQIATLVGVDPANYNGTFVLTGATAPYTLVLQNPSASGSYVSGGYVQTNAVYYYAVAKRSQNIILFGAYTADTASNRLQVNKDGLQIVAVVTLTNSGGQVSSSGGGGTPITGSPTAGSFF